MSILGNIGNWFKSLFTKAQEKAKQAWTLLAPLLEEMFKAELGVAVVALKDIALTAIAYVATKEFATDKEKRDAFDDYIKDYLKKRGEEAQQSAIDTALVVWLDFAKKNGLPH